MKQRLNWLNVEKTSGCYAVGTREDKIGIHKGHVTLKVSPKSTRSSSTFQLFETLYLRRDKGCAGVKNGE